MRRTGPASLALVVAWVVCPASSHGQEVSVIDGITFASEPGVLYVPIKEIGYRLGWGMRSEKKAFFVDERQVTIPRTLPDGTKLIRYENLAHLGLVLPDDTAGEERTILAGGIEIVVRQSEKRVVINKKEQLLRAFQGDRVVLETRVSTGRRGYTTPSGTWAAGPEKSRLRYSRKYDNAPMPWAVQVTGGYFMHGYTSVPKRPASHGCIRLPLWGVNPAKWLWHWIDLGTPVTIADDWAEDDGMSASAKKPASGPETIPVSDRTRVRKRP